MKASVSIRNESEWKRLCRRGTLEEIAARVCKGEGLRGSAEVSVLFCDDAFIRKLNRQYRGKDQATDVLSFEQARAPRGKTNMLGDIVISLETVARFCHNERRAMNREIRLLFCHGLLHLLGYDHASDATRGVMQEKQSAYLGVGFDAAWRDRDTAASGPARARGGGISRLGR